MLEIQIIGHVRRCVTALDGARHAFDRRVLVQGTAEGDDRRVVAAAHAGRAHHPHALSEGSRQSVKQILGAHQRTGETVADAHRQGWRRGLVLLDDVKVRVERGDLVYVRKRKAHLIRKRDQVTGMQATVVILQEVQVLDQQVGRARAIAEKRPHLVDGLRVGLAAAREVAGLAPAGARMDAAVGVAGAVRRRSVGLRGAGIVNVHRCPIPRHPGRTAGAIRDPRTPVLPTGSRVAALRRPG